MRKNLLINNIFKYYMFFGVLLGALSILVSCSSINYNIIEQKRTEEYKTFLYSNPKKIQIDNVKTITSGGIFVIATKNDGTVWSWGFNPSGQLGIGTRNSQSAPALINSLNNPKDIQAGIFHAISLKQDGTVWAWGYNDKGQLGLGHRRFESIPEQVFAMSQIVSIFAGYKTSFAIQEDGTVWAWGENNKGQLGIGNNKDQGSPQIIKELKDVKIIKIVSGDGYSIALDASGKIWVWGAGFINIMNRNGINKTDVPNIYKGLDNIKDIASRFQHVIALKNDGSLISWGRNREGQLGYGNSKLNQKTPRAIKSDISFDYIETGYTQSLALDLDRQLWAWGLNDKSQLGYKGTLITNIPRLIENINDIKEIKVGFAHIVALKNDGTVYIWGHDHGGYLVDRIEK